MSQRPTISVQEMKDYRIEHSCSLQEARRAVYRKLIDQRLRDAETVDDLKVVIHLIMTLQGGV
jgi:hypothetical protein